MDKAKIEDVLLAMGVPAGILGFAYIIDAMKIFDETGINIGITKELYPAIAEKNNTTASRVERAIRHAFEVTRAKGNSKEISKYIGFTNCNNSSSLKMLYKRIMQELGEPEKLKPKPEEETVSTKELRRIIKEELSTFFGKLSGDKP